MSIPNNMVILNFIVLCIFVFICLSGLVGKNLSDKRGFGKRKPHVLLRVQYNGKREKLQ